MEEYELSKVAQLLIENKIELVNCQSLGKMFWRYIPLSRLEEMLKDKNLAFIYPELWNDPFETRFLKTDFSALNNYMRPNKIYCLCGRGNGNEDASWKVYSDGSEPLICVRFNLKKLFPRIRSFVGINCNIYYSKVSYNLAEWRLKKIHDKNFPLHNTYFPHHFGESDYIRLMSLKRQSFAYEDEYRIFIVPQGNYKVKEKGGLVRIPIEYDIFERFTIGPMELVKKEDMHTFRPELKCETCENQKDSIINLIKNYYKNKTTVKSNICSSSLYKEVKPINKI